MIDTDFNAASVAGVFICVAIAPREAQPLGPPIATKPGILVAKRFVSRNVTV